MPRTTWFPSHLDPVEAKIIDNLLEGLIGKGYVIEVSDGEEAETLAAYTDNRHEIDPEVAATGITVLGVGKGKIAGKTVRLGSIILIHGNGEDVVSDLQARNSDLLNELSALVDSITEGDDEPQPGVGSDAWAKARADRARALLVEAGVLLTELEGAGLNVAVTWRAPLWMDHHAKIGESLTSETVMGREGTFDLFVTRNRQF